MSEVLLINPRKRRKAATKRRTTAKRRTTTAKRRTTRVRRNPAPRLGSTRRRSSRRRVRRNPIGIDFMPAAIGAGGALASDLALGYLPIPDSLKTGMARAAVRVGLGVALGMVIGKVAKNKTMGRQITAGALTVVAYDTVKKTLQQQMPSLPLSDVGQFQIYEYSDPSMDGLGLTWEDPEGMGELLIDDDLNGLGMAPDYFGTDFE